MKATLVSLFLTMVISFTAIGVNATSIKGPGDNTGLNGKVIDKNTGESLAGAVITIKGTDIKTYTDLDGNFAISNLAPGSYELEVSYISYQPVQLAAIETVAGKSSPVEIAILPEF